MSMKKVLIVGESGQDGRILQEVLQDKQVEIIGINSRFMIRNGERLELSIFDPKQVEDLIAVLQPDEIYYLAAYHASSEKDSIEDSAEYYELFHRVHVKSYLYFLQSVMRFSPGSRVFYAASSLLYNGSDGPIQSEKTAYSPVGFYGLTKLQGLYLGRYFREKHNLFISTGIMYSHESAYRKVTFLSKKLITAAYEISIGKRDSLVVGDLDAKNDWGYAYDHVNAMVLLLLADVDGEFVIGTGEAHSVREFAEAVFKQFGLDYLDYISVDASLLVRKSPVKIADIGKIKSATGWKPALNFDQMVFALVEDFLNSL